MDKARDQKGVTGTEFTKQAHLDRPSSSASNKSHVDVRLKIVLYLNEVVDVRILSVLNLIFKCLIFDF
jgi:hypothetical protein